MMAFEDPVFIDIYEQIDGQRTVDLEFYRKIAESANGPVLEAGCGSGRVLLPLLKGGIDISGFEPSLAMLDLLRTRAEGLTPNVWQGDFESINGSYAALISPFNTLMHLLDQDAQIRAFENVHRALKPGGVFAFDIGNPLVLDFGNERRVFEMTMEDLKGGQMYEVWRRFEHDPVRQVGKYHREFISGKRMVESTIEFRWSYPSEITLLLRLAGFSSWELLGDFESGAFDQESESQIWVARK